MVTSWVYKSRLAYSQLPDCDLPTNSHAVLGVEKQGLYVHLITYDGNALVASNKRAHRIWY